MTMPFAGLARLAEQGPDADLLRKVVERGARRVPQVELATHIRGHHRRPDWDRPPEWTRGPEVADAMAHTGERNWSPATRVGYLMRFRLPSIGFHGPPLGANDRP
jgi:hypothetical protein